MDEGGRLPGRGRLAARARRAGVPRAVPGAGALCVGGDAVEEAGSGARRVRAEVQGALGEGERRERGREKEDNGGEEEGETHLDFFFSKKNK